MNKTWLMVGGGVLALLVVGGVLMMNNGGGSADDRQKMMAEPTSAAMQPTGTMMDDGGQMEISEANVKEFVVEGSNFKFSLSEMKVKKGETVRVVFKNVEGMHDWVVNEFDAKTSVINGGEEETIEFVADKAGTYEYYCSVGQHRKMGMVGKLIVEE